MFDKVRVYGFEVVAEVKNRFNITRKNIEIIVGKGGVIADVSRVLETANNTLIIKVKVNGCYYANLKELEDYLTTQSVVL